MAVRVGIGYDSHRLPEPGERLVIGGVEIEHEKGLAGHSDADVLIHALIDALLGSMWPRRPRGLPPPSEEEWKDADSMDMLRIVVGRLTGAVVNVDATVICEEPKLGPLQGGDVSTSDRGAVGAGERQGFNQRGHGRHRPW